MSLDDNTLFVTKFVLHGATCEDVYVVINGIIFLLKREPSLSYPHRILVMDANGVMCHLNFIDESHKLRCMTPI